MSDSLITFQPAIEEPSNMIPSANASSLTSDTSIVRCCIFPRGSVKRRSTYLTSLSLNIASTDSALLLFAMCIALCGSEDCQLQVRIEAPSERVRPGLTRPDPDGLFYRGNEDLAIADSPRTGGRLDGLDRLVDKFVGNDDFDLYLRQEVHDILGTAIELGMSLLASETLRFGHCNDLQSHFLQRLLHLVELEGFDVCLDFLHASSSWQAGDQGSDTVSSTAGAWPMPTGREGGSPAISTGCVHCLGAGTMSLAYSL